MQAAMGGPSIPSTVVILPLDTAFKYRPLCLEGHCSRLEKLGDLAETLEC